MPSHPFQYLKDYIKELPRGTSTLTFNDTPKLKVEKKRVISWHLPTSLFPTPSNLQFTAYIKHFYDSRSSLLFLKHPPTSNSTLKYAVN
jgi:hypothetical protein